MKIEPLDDLGLCCQVVDDFDDEVEDMVEQEEVKPVLYYKNNGYVTGIGWPPSYNTEGKKGVFVADALMTMAEVLKKYSKKLDSVTTPEEDQEQYNNVVSAMWACYGILDDFKVQICRLNDVWKAGDQWSRDDD